MLAVAVSGGVDSLASLLLLKKSGHDLVALHGLFHGNASVPAGLAEICSSLDIPFHILDFTEIFAEKVIDPFVEAFAAGLTPNPCALCNREVKFGALARAARRLGASGLATGHYARLGRQAGGGVELMAGADAAKDQSYFLSLTAAEDLACARFPLAAMTKPQARQFVAESGRSAPVAAESQDICFLGPGGRDAFLSRRLASRPGPVFLCGEPGAPLRQVGVHTGLWNYTAGQRRGLGISWREPLYVRQVDAENNAIVLAPRRLASMKGVVAVRPNILVEPRLWPDQLWVKLRYNQKMAAASVSVAGGAVVISLEQPMLATAPGQVAVVYDSSGRVLCGAIVRDVTMALAAAPEAI